MNLQPCQVSQNTAIPGSNTPSIKSQLVHKLVHICLRLNRLWQNLTHILANDEPRVWPQLNRRGQIVSWHIYDPKSGYTIQLGSEIEVRLWLEHRF